METVFEGIEYLVIYKDDNGTTRKKNMILEKADSIAYYFTNVRTGKKEIIPHKTLVRMEEVKV